MNPTRDPKVEDVMARWRRLVAVSVRPATDTPPGDLDAEYAAAITLADGRWLPPRRGLPDGLAAVMAEWDASWTTGLRASDTWATAKSRLADVRQLLAVGKTQSAQMKLESLLEDGYPPVREALVAGSKVRWLNAGSPLSPEEVHEALKRLVAWLERV